MPYSVKATRVDDGRYNLAFGKGGKKLTGLLRCLDGNWFVTAVGFSASRVKLKREAIAAFETWAAGQYGVANTSCNSDASPESPPPVVDDEGPDAITWAQAFAFLANAGRPKTATRRNDLILLLQSLLAEQEKEPKHGKAICPPPTFTPKVAEVERESPVEAPTADADASLDREAGVVSGEE